MVAHTEFRIADAQFLCQRYLAGSLADTSRGNYVEYVEVDTISMQACVRNLGMAAVEDARKKCRENKFTGRYVFHQPFAVPVYHRCSY